MIIAGIDEAGYGPLLGPLVVSCVALDLEGENVLPVTVEALPCCWKLLKAGVVKKMGAGAKGRILVADSKVVRQLADGDKFLERGVLAFLRGMMEGEWEGISLWKLLERLGCGDHGLWEHRWYVPHDVPLPRWAEAGDLGIAANILRGAMAKAGVKVAAMRTAPVPEGAFNRLVNGTNNKAAALVSITLRHLYGLHQEFGGRGLVVGIDKQGGRDHYTQLLLQSFPEATLKVLQEDEKGSSYMLVEERGGEVVRRTILHFREKGETKFLPTALASMMCKYLRELCMEGFNAWWCGQVEGLRPTAGYYQDGMRWLGDVEGHLGRLGVRREELVRVR